MKNYVVAIKKTGRGILYFDVPKKIIEKLNLKPFMAAEMKAKENGIVISNFQKTIKVRLELDKKTIDAAKRIMKEEGYGSLDETISNVILWAISKEKKHIVYLYPEEYIRRRYLLIEDYEKRKTR